MTARTLALLPLLLIATAAQAHPGHDPEGLHTLIHALADLDPRATAIAVAGLIAVLLMWRRRATALQRSRPPLTRDR